MAVTDTNERQSDERAINWMQGQAEDGAPFCAWGSFANPHEMTNLHDDPARAAMRTELEALINRRANDMIPLQTQIGVA